MAATVLIRVIQDCICSAFLPRIIHRSSVPLHGAHISAWLAYNIKGLIIRECSPAVDKDIILEPINAGEKRDCFTLTDPLGAHEKYQIESA